VVSDAYNEAIAKVCGVPLIKDFNGAQQEGASTYQQTCRNRRRSSTSVAFLYPAIARGNVELLDETHVTSLVLEKNRVVGVSYMRKGTAGTARANAEVVLSSGVIGSPQILMLSGIGPADHLRSVGVNVVHDLPGVGANLHDHLMTPLRYHATKDTGHRSTPAHFIGGMLNEFLLGRGWIGKTFLEGGAFVKTSPDQPRPNLQLLSIPWAYPEPNDDFPEKAKICKTPCFTMLPGLIYPKSRGELRLRSNNPSDAPLLDPHYLEVDDDLKILMYGVRLCREIARAQPLAKYFKGEATPGDKVQTEEELRAFIRLYSKTIYHPVGTCKMGPDPMAVVDAKLRVHGIEGLRVADASIMPSITGGNTNAPSIMIGEKAADMIKAARQGETGQASARAA
jgi:choline dehydrogenase-like flavoprotein